MFKIIVKVTFLNLSSLVIHLANNIYDHFAGEKFNCHTIWIDINLIYYIQRAIMEYELLMLEDFEWPVTTVIFASPYAMKKMFRYFSWFCCNGAVHVLAGRWANQQNTRREHAGMGAWFGVQDVSFFCRAHGSFWMPGRNRRHPQSGRGADPVQRERVLHAQVLMGTHPESTAPAGYQDQSEPEFHACWGVESFPTVFAKYLTLITKEPANQSIGGLFPLCR